MSWLLISVLSVTNIITYKALEVNAKMLIHAVVYRTMMWYTSYWRKRAWEWCDSITALICVASGVNPFKWAFWRCFFECGCQKYAIVDYSRASADFGETQASLCVKMCSHSLWSRITARYPEEVFARCHAKSASKQKSRKQHKPFPAFSCYLTQILGITLPPHTGR